MIAGVSIYDEAVQSPVSNLSPAHWAEMEASTLTAETVVASGIRTEYDQTRLAIMLGRKSFPKTQCPALVIPYYRLDGSIHFHRVKPANDKSYRSGEKRPPKYASPVGSAIEPYFNRLASWQEVIRDPSTAITVTEGEKKALAIQQLGHSCIGLAGVDCFVVPGSMRLVPALEVIAWKGRNVFIAYDSDQDDKPQVRLAQSKLAKLLQDQGAIVKILKIPSGEAGEKYGADDFIAADGADAFHKLYQQSQEPEPLDPGDYKENANQMDPAIEARWMLEQDRYDGGNRLRFWRGSFYRWGRGRYMEISDDEMRARVIQSLNSRYHHVGIGHTNAVVDQLKAQCMLLRMEDAPAWVPGEDRDGIGATLDSRDVVVCRNGIVNIPAFVAGRSGYLIPATPRFFNLNALDFDFDPQAPTPTAWLEFLDQLFSSDPDTVLLIQEWLGYIIACDTRLQKILFLLGPPRGGKGTLIRVATKLVGERNVATPSMSDLAGPFGMWPLVDASLAVVADARVGNRSDISTITARLLGVSGEDRVDVHRKSLPTIRSVRLKTRFMLASNELPRLGDSSTALLNRLLIVAMSESFLGRENLDLESQLETELPGILLWALGGWQRLRKNGKFTVPASSEGHRDDFMEISSPVTVFANEKLIFGPAFKTTRDEIYAAWQAWCETAGKHPGDRGTFGRDFKAAFPALVPKQLRSGETRTRAYHGVGIRGSLANGDDF